MADEQRRERKQFEPPPWEKEAFEAFAAKRAEQEAAERATAEALTALIEPEDKAPVTADMLAAELAAAMKAKADAAAAEAAETIEAGEAVTMPGATPAVPDDKVVAAMMLELSQEDASDANSAKIVAWVASGVTAVLGLAMVIGGLTLAARAQGQNAAVIGSAVLTVFGLIFGGMAAWVWISSNRVRGR